METDKAKEEAILRAKQSTESNTQAQEQLLDMQKRARQTNSPQTAPLNESHHNLMQSWHNLQDMDYTLAEKGTLDMEGKAKDDEK